MCPVDTLAFHSESGELHVSTMFVNYFLLYLNLSLYLNFPLFNFSLFCKRIFLLRPSFFSKMSLGLGHCHSYFTY